MLSAAQLAAFRAASTRVLDMTADIQRNTPGADGYGHQTASWAAVATGVACGLNKPSAALLQAYAAKLGALQSWLVSLPYGTTISEGDRVIVGGQTLLVQADVSLSSYSTLVQVLASEVR